MRCFSFKERCTKYFTNLWTKWSIMEVAQLGGKRRKLSDDKGPGKRHTQYAPAPREGHIKIQSQTRTRTRPPNQKFKLCPHTHSRTRILVFP